MQEGAIIAVNSGHVLQGYGCSGVTNSGGGTTMIYTLAQDTTLITIYAKLLNFWLNLVFSYCSAESFFCIKLGMVGR